MPGEVTEHLLLFEGQFAPIALASISLAFSAYAYSMVCILLNMTSTDIRLYPFSWSTYKACLNIMVN